LAAAADGARVVFCLEAERTIFVANDIDRGSGSRTMQGLSENDSHVAESRWLLRFLLDESGQDLIEYALLTAFIGFAGIFVWTNIMATIGTKYSGWDSGVQGLSACTPDPQASGGGGCP
jgi:Flp pilus assembly pilin Flp